MMRKLKRTPLTQQLNNTLRILMQRVATLKNALEPSFAWLMMAALIALSLVIFSMLSGCTTTRVVRPPLPAQAQPRPLPPFDGRTYRDVVQYVIEVREWGMACEADKAAIRYVYMVPKR